MSSIDYVPAGPLDTAPTGGYTPPEDRRQTFLAALAGVELGDYDNRIIDWLSNLDDPTCRTIISLINRARQPVRAEAQADVDLVNVVSQRTDAEQAYLARFIALRHPEVAKEALEALAEYRDKYAETARLHLGEPDDDPDCE